MAYPQQSARRRELERATRHIIEDLEDRTFLSASIIDGVLNIVGTEQADTVLLQPGKSKSQLRVEVNGGAQLFPFADFSTIKLDLLGGDDILRVWEIGKSITTP